MESKEKDCPICSAGHLDERAAELYHYDEDNETWRYAMKERAAYIKGYTDSTHHTHASFVALVEGHKIPKWASSQTVEGYEYAKKEFIDLLNKIKL